MFSKPLSTFEEFKTNKSVFIVSRRFFLVLNWTTNSRRGMKKTSFARDNEKTRKSCEHGPENGKPKFNQTKRHKPDFVSTPWCAPSMISKSNVKLCSMQFCVCPCFLEHNAYWNNIRIGFCDIWNNQGLSKCYQPRPSAQLMSFSQSSPLIIPEYHKTSSHNIYCLMLTKWTKTVVAQPLYINL